LIVIDAGEYAKINETTKERCHFFVLFLSAYLEILT